jgi:hypothetical protein
MAFKPPPRPPKAELGPAQMRQGILRFKRCIAEVEKFSPNLLPTYEDTSRVEALSASVEGALDQTFGYGPVEYERYSAAIMSMGHPTSDTHQNLLKSRTRSLHLLRQAVSFLEQELELHGSGPEQGRLASAPRVSMTSSGPDQPQRLGTNAVIGHGRSPAWRELKDFIKDRLSLAVNEFNSISPAGIPTVERLTSMSDGARFAFLIMTAEDEQADGKIRGRENVVHEVGLFQGRLGFNCAIVLLEDGCEPFS